MARSSPVAVGLLIVANLVPLVGALFLGWDVPTILFTYWLENGIVGLLNVPKMLIAGGRGPLATVGAADGLGGRVILAGFFLVHYGIFWIVHGVFLVFLTRSVSLGGLDPIGYVLSEPAILFAAGLLFVSHTASLFINFIGRREYLQVSVGTQMFRPYPRMAVLHVAIILGGFVIIAAGEPALLVALLVALKTIVDLVLHAFEHSRRAAPGSPPSAALA